MKDRIGFAVVLALAIFIGGASLACAHEGHNNSVKAPLSAAQSISPVVVFRNQASESTHVSSSTGSLSMLGAQGESPESCICCGSSHEAVVTAAAPTFSDQKKQAAGAAGFRGALPPAIVQSRTLIAVREHGPPVASVKIHLLINIFLI